MQWTSTIWSSAPHDVLDFDGLKEDSAPAASRMLELSTCSPKSLWRERGLCTVGKQNLVFRYLPLMTSRFQKQGSGQS